MNRIAQPVVSVVIPILNPPRDLGSRLTKLRKQADRIILVDDGSDSDWDTDGFSQLVEVIRHEGNRGIAAALNTGISAIIQDSDYVLTLDQDSELADDFVKRCVEQASIMPTTFGFLCAEFMNDSPVPAQKNLAGETEPYDPMQSGFFIPVATFERIGFFDESLIIDGVDTEYTLRARASGLKVAFANGTQMQHSLGTLVRKQIFGRRLGSDSFPAMFSAHSPLRLFYISRNRLLINRRYLRRFPLWCARRAYDDVQLVGRNLIFGEHKTKSAQAVLSGLWTGVRGRSGKISNQVLLKLNG